MLRFKKRDNVKFEWNNVEFKSKNKVQKNFLYDWWLSKRLTLILNLILANLLIHQHLHIKKDDSLVVDLLNCQCEALSWTASTPCNLDCILDKFFLIPRHVASSGWAVIQILWFERPFSIPYWESTTHYSFVSYINGILIEENAEQRSMNLTRVSMKLNPLNLRGWLDYDVAWLNVSTE